MAQCVLGLEGGGWARGGLKPEVPGLRVQGGWLGLFSSPRCRGQFKQDEVAAEASVIPRPLLVGAGGHL